MSTTSSPARRSKGHSKKQRIRERRLLNYANYVRNKEREAVALSNWCVGDTPVAVMDTPSEAHVKALTMVLPPQQHPAIKAAVAELRSLDRLIVNCLRPEDGVRYASSSWNDIINRVNRSYDV